MAYDTVLHVWPSATNCLAWSQDCELAVAADEHVELLIPKLRVSNVVAEHPTNLWDILHLRVNLFSESEVKSQEPLSFQNFSAGEEISPSSVVSLSWSPPGLAKHGKCTLAILTSNLALSIWAPDAKPSSALSWKRRLVLNRTMEDILQESEELQGMDGDKSLEMLRRLQRIRAFAWSPPLRFSSIQHPPSPADIWGHNLIAVSNDCNQVALVKITSPHQQIPTDQKTWESSIQAHFSTAHFDDDDLPKLAWTYDDYLRKRDYASHLAWSPWLNVDDSSLQSFLAYATHTKVAIRRIETSSESHNPTCDATDIYSDSSISSPIVGQLRWFPKTSTDGNLVLIATFGDHIRCYQVPVSDPHDVKIIVCFREEWEEISGLAFSSLIEGDTLYYSNFIPAPKATTAVQITPSLHPLDASAPHLQEKLRELQEKFSDSHNLDGRVRTKVWGMASPPLGDLIATVFSFHPSDLPEYLIAADQESNLTITDAVAGNDPALTLPINGGLDDPKNISSENLVFTLLRWLNRHKDIPREDGSLFQDLCDELSSTLAATSDRSEREYAPSHEDASISFAVKSLRNSLYESREARSRICQHLSSLLAPSPLHSVTNDTVLQALTFTVLSLPPGLRRGGSVTKKIIRNYKTTLSRVQPAAKEKLGNAPSFEEEGFEHCTICNSNSVIPFTEFDFARGACGHQFARCTLTFLAIQAPGISKVCGICGKQYLTENYLLKEDTFDDCSSESSESPTLLQLLLTAFDKCIYCGGKFVG